MLYWYENIMALGLLNHHDALETMQDDAVWISKGNESGSMWLTGPKKDVDRIFLFHHFWPKISRKDPENLLHPEVCPKNPQF